MIAAIFAPQGLVVGRSAAVKAPSAAMDFGAVVDSKFDGIWSHEAKMEAYNAWDPEKPRSYDNFNPFERNDEAQQCETLRNAFKLEWVVLTRGALGTAIQTGKQFVQGEPARFDRADDADSVGAGDSVTAAILVGRLLQRPVQQIADYANQVGAFVASQPGATPAMPDEIVGRIRHVCGNDQ